MGLRFSPFANLPAFIALLALAGIGPAARAQAPAAPPNAQQAPPPRAGEPADGRTFRILDRFCKDVDGAVTFRGRIVRTIAVSRATAGDHSLCVNCAEEKAAPRAEAGQPQVQHEAAQALRPLGELLVLDLSRLWRTYFDEGGLVFRNFDGYDADGREYGAYPVAGPDTATYLLGSMLLIGNVLPEKPDPRNESSGGFQLVLRRLGGTYLAPIGGGDKPPEKVSTFGPSEHVVRALARSHHKSEPDWAERYKTEYRYRDGLTRNGLMDSIALLAASDEDFLMVLDLRKLESKKASYFWAPLRPRPSVHLDENTLAIEGGSGEGAYEPYTFVEYPYLVIISPYARIKLAPLSGAPESRLVVGFCDECP